jgi:BirA family biotin operon repressor/biotin-[acetyl-CoA-carboxylase] ligase
VEQQGFSGYGEGILVWLDETDSTMDRARELYERGAPHGSVVAADYQRAGRGRGGGRFWHARPGESLLFSLILRGEGLAAMPSLRAGLGLCLALEGMLGMGPADPRAPRVKWPNDLLAGNRKLAGILCEGAPGRLVVGIGVNVGQRCFPPEIEGKAGSLALAYGIEPDRRELLRLVLAGIERAMGIEDALPMLNERLWKRGGIVSFKPGGPESEGSVRGRLAGLAPDGSLVIEGAHGAERFASGELAYEAAIS